MKKIIVPIDFSKHSEYALQVAANLAKKTNAELLILHMLEVSEAVLTSTSSEQQLNTLFLLKSAKNRFDDFLKKDYLENVKTSVIIKHFKVFSEIIDVAHEHNADLVVMGSHGSSGVKEVFIGSNTEKVVRTSDIPVLVIKNNILDLEFESVVFVSDFKEENVRPYQKATKLFKSYWYYYMIVLCCE